MELEWGSGEKIGDAGIADDDGAIAVGGDDAFSDWFVVLGAVVEGLEGGV